ncbi:MAG: hypothetical protein ACRDST_23000 [Pseudonocardiaceae bacterium]
MRELLPGAVPVHVLHHAAEGELHGAWMTAELARHEYHFAWDAVSAAAPDAAGRVAHLESAGGG